MKTCKSIIKLITLCISVFLPILMHAQSHVPRKAATSVEQKRRVKLRDSVEANINDPEAHTSYINMAGPDSVVIKQYRKWMVKYPQVWVIPYSIGINLSHGESPDAEEFLLKAVALNPKLADAWEELAWGQSMRGNTKQCQAYLKKAFEIDTTNADAAFYYANSFLETDTSTFRSLSVAFIKKFPTHKRAAQALYWLAAYESDPAKKNAWYETLRNNEVLKKTDWYKYGMDDYYQATYISDPEKALAIAREEHIPGRIKLQDTILKVKTMVANNNAASAFDTIKNVALHNIYKRESFYLFKAMVAGAANNYKAAYDTIAKFYCKIPSDTLKKTLYYYGDKLGLNKMAVDSNIRSALNAKAEIANGFTLYNYFTGKNSSLSDYKGKVILLTFWFPGCGPCRAEMPHFEKIIKEMKPDNFVYLALNLQPDQDKLVLPFVKSSGYSFIPLRDSWHRKAGNLQAKGAPTNFIIDNNGRIIFSDFMINSDNEDSLKLMLSEVLDLPKTDYP